MSNDFDTPAVSSAATDTPNPDDQALASLIGSSFNLTGERDIQSIDSIGLSVKGANRAALKMSNPKAYEKVKELACASIKDKFSLMKVIDEKSTVKDFQSIYSIEIRLRELHKSLKESDLLPVFTIFHQWESSIRPNRSKALPIPGPSDLNLLKKFNGTSVDNIKRSTEFWLLSGGDYHVEDIRWSGEKILASCDDALREKVLESVQSIPQIYHGGPLFFYYMMTFVTTTSDQAMRVVVDKVNRLRLSDFDGENVLVAVSFLRGAIQLLSNNSAVPHDILNTVFNMMRSCSTPAFVSFVTNLETMFKLPDLVKDGSVEFLLDKLESKYTSLLGSSQWLAHSVTPNAAGFNSTSHSDDQDEVICFNCGALGHKSNVCPQPRDADRIRRYSSAIRGSSSASDPKSRNSRRSGGDNKEVKSKKTPDALRTPPRPGETHTKTFPSLGERHWCGRCTCWTDHGTSNHPPSADASPSENAAPAASNVASGHTSTATPSVAATDDSVSISSGPASASMALGSVRRGPILDEDGFELVRNPRTTYSAALANGLNFS